MKRTIFLFVLFFLALLLSVFIYKFNHLTAQEEYVCCECTDDEGDSIRQWVRRSVCEDNESCNILYLDHDQCHN